MARGPFDDRTVTLTGTPDQLARLADLLGSRTRLAVLETLVRSKEPLHINEIARRVGVDASPVRTHLELLLRERVVEEVPSTGRERRFATRLTDARLVLEGVNRSAPAEGPTSKLVQKLERKLKDLEKDVAKLDARARRVQQDLETARKAAAKAG